MTGPQLYTPAPDPVTALRFDAADPDGMRDWIGGSMNPAGRDRTLVDCGDRWVEVTDGDWVVLQHGRFHVIPDDAFRERFRLLVHDEVPTDVVYEVPSGAGAEQQ